ncbi:MAG: ethanolamine ammonia-lyase subunit EutC [Desulfofundulus sp.]
MVADDQIKEIVQAVLSQLLARPDAATTGTEPQGESKAAQPSPAGTAYSAPAVAGDRAPGTDGGGCGVDNKEDDDEKLEDLTLVDLQKEILVPNPVDRAALEYFKSTTPARIGVWRSGPRPLTRTVLRFRADHAVAQDAVFSELDESLAARFDLLPVQSQVRNKDEYLTRPDLGKKLSPDSVEKIRQHCPGGVDVQLVVADGLSSRAISANLPHILPPLLEGLKAQGLTVGKGVLVRYGRVEIMDQIGMLVQAKVVVLLVGERPGLGTAESMSAYLIYQPHEGTLIADHTVVSNIHKGGTPPAEAGAYLATLIRKIYDAKASGVNLPL